MREKILRHLWWATFSVAIALLIAHSFRLTNVAVDDTSIFLLIVMLISPFVATVKKLKFGDFEAEIDPEEVERVKKDAEVSLAQSPAHQGVAPEVSQAVANIRSIAQSDHVLALAKLRIEIEKVLRKTAESLNVTAPAHVTKPLSLGALLHMLATHEVIPPELASPLRTVIAICNRAIHGEVIKETDAHQIVETGTNLLESLYARTADIVHGRVVEETAVQPAEVHRYEQLSYRLTTIVPLVHGPRRIVREVTQHQLQDYLEGYYEFAEFVISLEPLEK
jgi:hypothetical protein